MNGDFAVSTSQSVGLVLKIFLSLIKIALVLCVLTVGALVVSQSSVAPVSVRLLTSYAMEFAVANLKPVRPYFPAPYAVEIETH